MHPPFVETADVTARLLPFALAGLLTALACSPQVTPSPAPSTAGPAATPSSTPTVARPSSTAAPTASPSPSRSSAPAPLSCPAQNGGKDPVQAQLTAVRVAHQPGFDRVVFEFGPTSVGPYGMPLWEIATTTTFTGISGKQVPVDGNAFLQVRFRNASTVDPNTGVQTYSQTDFRPGLPLVREVKLIDDFERVMTWGLGLERLQCANVTELASPVRLVVDLPTPP